MKKLPVIATLLLVMGLVLLPACDENKGTDPLVLAALSSSKYYLEFDADYDNDGSVDEHVKMRVREPFDHKPYNNSYEGYFINQSDYSYISIPETITGPTNYVGSDVNFYVVFYKDHDHYSSYSDHPFLFNVTQWDGIGGEMYAEFSGEASNNNSGEEKIAHLTNGRVFSKIRE